ncbi:hypothetical protein QBC39DRAFT_342244 [Podospora conica]|nr:hypothetical protein QBC39DRAFT_342244 [Schizothecium conicum]
MRLTTALPLLAYAVGLSSAARLAVASVGGEVAEVAELESATPCGFKIAPCRSGYTCVANDPTCPPLRGENCAGKCLKAKPTLTTAAPTKTPKPTKTPRPTKASYQSCGGMRIEQVFCPKGSVCVDDPHVEGCGMACDRPGICVDATKAEFCGGFAGFRCPEGKICIDDPRDDCSVENGGADCGGMCV